MIQKQLTSKANQFTGFLYKGSIMAVNVVVSENNLKKYGLTFSVCRTCKSIT